MFSVENWRILLGRYLKLFRNIQVYRYTFLIKLVILFNCCHKNLGGKQMKVGIRDPFFFTKEGKYKMEGPGTVSPRHRRW
jgi:hypothetical protein